MIDGGTGASWVEFFGSPQDDTPEGVAADAAGNAILTCTVGPATDFGGGPAPQSNLNRIVKLDATGVFVWQKAFSAGVPGGYVTVDGAGAVVSTGLYKNAIDFGGGALPPGKPVHGYAQYLVKLAADGSHVWSKSFEPEAVDGPDSLGGIMSGLAAIGPANAVYFGGTFSGAIDVGGGKMYCTMPSCIFLSKRDAAGNFVWSKSFDPFPSGPGIACTSLSVDETGNIGIACQLSGGSIQLGSSTVTAPATPGDAVLVAKFDATGNPIFAHGYGTQVSRGVAVLGAAGHTFIVASAMGSIDFGGGALASSGQETDLFVARLDPAGNVVWQKRFGSAGNDFVQSIAVDGAGNLGLAGTIGGPTDFGGGPIAGLGGFFAKLDGAGNHLSSHSVVNSVGPGVLVATGTLSSAGDEYLFGMFQGSVDAGSGVHASLGGSDLFLGRYAP